MDSRDFLRLAAFLATAHSHGARAYRSAISRAYYAAFHVAQGTLAGLGVPPTTGPGGHGEVIALLQNCGDAGRIPIASMLDDLKGWRNDADYRLDMLTIENSTSTMIAIETADEIVKELDDFDGDVQRKRQAEPIAKSYARNVLKKII
jgi:uncharacterized protein (UPF0332 family)